MAADDGLAVWAERRDRSAVVIVTGSIEAQPDSIDHLLALSLAHVRRSVSMAKLLDSTEQLAGTTRPSTQKI